MSLETEKSMINKVYVYALVCILSRLLQFLLFEKELSQTRKNILYFTFILSRAQIRCAS